MEEQNKLDQVLDLVVELNNKVSSLDSKVSSLDSKLEDFKIETAKNFEEVKTDLNNFVEHTTETLATKNEITEEFFTAKQEREDNYNSLNNEIKNNGKKIDDLNIKLKDLDKRDFDDTNANIQDIVELKKSVKTLEKQPA
ncbi:MAG: hypothetical protein AUJ23_02035 [Candidatus Magasanikbacteria bacterium CG1_02_32_51]|uniref:Uncharacterized protein n=1 Tax=Candidatus Magasanikbacteria bacterium CG1_02_32_51 TaxID=1805238 RepID=A0A1J4U869_9BACT|nr:MAG: hypothetical protein AUJ23_02035 [Candidatus Magasanikbacteria bacterium CG1_02_32_51]